MNVDCVQWLKALAPCPCWDTNQALRLCLGTKATGADFGAVSALSINHDCSRLLCGFAKGQVLFHDVFMPSQPHVIIVIPRAWFDEPPICEAHPIISPKCFKFIFISFSIFLSFIFFFTHAHFDSVGFRVWKKFLIFCPCLFCNANVLKQRRISQWSEKLVDSGQRRLWGLIHGKPECIV